MKNLKVIMQKIRGNDFYLVLLYAWFCLIFSAVITIWRFYV